MPGTGGNNVRRQSGCLGEQQVQPVRQGTQESGASRQSRAPPKETIRVHASEKSINTVTDSPGLALALKAASAPAQSPKRAARRPARNRVWLGGAAGVLLCLLLSVVGYNILLKTPAADTPAESSAARKANGKNSRTAPSKQAAGLVGDAPGIVPGIVPGITPGIAPSSVADTRQATRQLDPVIPGANYALQFNMGSDLTEIHQVLVPSLHDNSESLTMEMWTQRDGTRSRAHSWILGFHNNDRIGASSTRLFGVSFDRVEEDQGVSIVSDDISLAIEKPAHLAFVRDALRKEIRFYADGTLMGREPFITVQSGGELQICSDARQWCAAWEPAEAVPRYAGWIDEVRISDTPRYEANFDPQPRFEPDKQTLALYHFDEGQGDILKDSSRHRHHGQIIGAKWIRVDH